VRSSIKFGGARRVLFLVDRSNLGEQAEKEFAIQRLYSMLKGE